MGNFRIGEYDVGRSAGRDGAPLLLIAGPCVLQTEALVLSIAERLVDIVHQGALAGNINLVFKASFDKANRTRGDSFRGPGIDVGLALLAKVRDQFAIPVTTDIHLPEQAAIAADVCELLQIPAFLCRQTDLLIAAAQTGRAVNVKKGQFLAPSAMQHVVAKLSDAGCQRTLVCERGTFFGYGQMVNDMGGLAELQTLGCPVVFDATHSVQQPASQDGVTGGNREKVPVLARAAMAVGIDGLFLETHPDPDSSPSDGANMLPLDALPELLECLLRIRKATFPNLSNTT